MSFKQIRNYPRNLAKPYVVVPNKDIYDVVKASNVANNTYSLSATEISLSFSNGAWSGGFPYVNVTFKLKNYKCKALRIDVLRGSGYSLDVRVNGVLQSGLGTHYFEIPSNVEDVEVALQTNHYAESGSTDTHSAWMTVGNIEFLKR